MVLKSETDYANNLMLTWNDFRFSSDSIIVSFRYKKYENIIKRVIEKHFTLDKTLPGNDHYHAGEPEDFMKAIENFKWIDIILGSGEKTVLECEQIPRREARRSLVLTRNMKAGEEIRKEDLMPKRPGTGISPIYTDIVVGRRVIKDLIEDTILTWDMI